jgi:hypothetical protein
MAAGRVLGVSRLLSLHTCPTASTDGFRLDCDFRYRSPNDGFGRNRVLVRPDRN